jgi:putative ABC transport system permease protein
VGENPHPPQSVFGHHGLERHTFQSRCRRAGPLRRGPVRERNTKYYELREDFLPIAFLPSAQDEVPGAGVTFVLRTSGPAADIFHVVNQAVARVNPGIDLEFHILMPESLLRDRLMAALAGGFGLLAGLLATLGLYGVIAYMVERRRSEIGIRMALGADRGRVVRLILRGAFQRVLIGLLLGIPLAIGAGHLIASELYGVKSWDPLALGVAAAALAICALIASLIPASRAAAVSPTTALRIE